MSYFNMIMYPVALFAHSSRAKIRAAAARLLDWIAAGIHSAFLYEKLGRRAFRLNEYLTAAGYFTECLTLRDNPEIRLELAESLFKAKRFGAAAANWRMLRKSMPKRPEPIAGLARILAVRKEHEKAIALLERESFRRILGPADHAGVLRIIGNHHRAAGDIDKALEVFMKLLSLQPTDSGVMYRVGEIEEERGDWEKARKFYLGAFAHGSFSLPAYRRFLFSCWMHETPITPDEIPCGPDIREILRAINPPATERALFADFPGFADGYWKTTCRNHDDAQTVLYKCAYHLADLKNETYTFDDGFRRNPNEPAEYDNSIYLIGDSSLYGIWLPDAMTVGGHLQVLFNGTVRRMRVLSIGTGAQKPLFSYLQFKRLELRSGDWVVTQYPLEWPLPLFDRASIEERVNVFVAMDRECREKGASFHALALPRPVCIHNPNERERIFSRWEKETRSRENPLFARMLNPSERESCQLKKSGVRLIELTRLADRPHDMGEVFFDRFHFNHRLAKRVAEALFEHFEREPAGAGGKGVLSAEGSSARAMADSIAALKKRVRRTYGSKPHIQRWIKEVRRPEFAGRSSVGSIVVNANPFTCGHLHLVEHALEKAEVLYLFVVLEDKAEFSFADRLHMVREGVRHFGDRVFVTSTGNVFVTPQTSPGYFSKDTLVDPKLTDNTLSMCLFGAIIAPALGITHRFLGDEPYCAWTRRLNFRAQFLLPDMGTKVEVIKRKERDGTVVSASHVRKALKDNDHELVRTMVPESTYRHLIHIGYLK